MEMDSRVDDAAIVVAETENRRAIERAEGAISGGENRSGRSLARSSPRGLAAADRVPRDPDHPAEARSAVGSAARREEFSRRSFVARASERASERADEKGNDERGGEWRERERERASERERAREGKGGRERRRQNAREADASLKFPRYRRTSKQLIKARVPTDR